MTTATKAGGAVLPVVCYVAQRDGLPKFGAGWMFSKIETGPATLALTPHASAQATIDELRAEVERLTMRAENLSAEGQLAYKVSENVGRNALQCAQDLLQKNIELRALVAEMLELSDNWPGVAYAYELEARARASLLGDGGTL